MILGVGVDICTASRIQKQLGNDRFMDRVFTRQERDYFASRGKMKASSAAACFAAKEAFSKALGTGIGPVAFSEIEIFHEPNGRPVYRLHGKTRELAGEKGLITCHLSLSHEGDTAAAFCVLEGLG